MVELNGTKIAILVADGFEQAELVEPKAALEKAGAETEVISLEEGEVQGIDRGEKAGRFHVDKALCNAIEANYAALLLPGGAMSPDILRGQADALNFVKLFFQHEKPVYAICHGPQVLISAEVIRGRRTTSHPAVAEDLKNAGAEWVDESVVVDGNLVTSRNPNDLPEFCDAITKHLASNLAEFR